MTPTRILIVDDQALIRSGLRMILDAEPGFSVIGEASDGREGIQMIKRLRPDVVLMDIRMPVMDGIDATRQLVDSGLDPEPRVLILTTFDLDEYVYAAIRAGASGFLLKDAPPDDLIHAIRVVARGEALLAPSVTRRLIEEFASRPEPDAAPEGMDELTEREIEVLQSLAAGLSNAEIATELFVSEATVKTHISHILTKLDLRDRVQAVVVAYESGLVRPGENPQE
ncbi:MAG: response regulator transcription factor [Actinomycetota bacterium]|nr:response regulator transcription factor [Actinomycetota bacterium]